jgi:flavorubredoxin
VKGVNLKGKVGAAFGSYGWSGEAPKLLLEIMKNKFEMQVTEPPLLSKYVPDEKTLAMCRDLGKRVSETLMHQA